ncbi:MAG: type II toxin-antitoxin system RelE/ParE family toxin [Azospirillaceae bacterium]|nr:type II toxin-antitoxin system RelE/ParE family toxin [Azospirillaceae bacterium]
MAIKSCRDKDTASFLAGKHVRQFQAIERQAQKALTKLTVVSRLVELRNPPSNRFEALGGDRSGEYSIRINDQWRVCFRWEFTQADPEGTDPLMRQGQPYDVEITDYH